MKVLFQLLDAGVGGGQIVAARVAEALAARGDELGLVVPAPGPAADRFHALGAEMITMDAGTLRRPGAALRLAGILRRYDLLYSHTSTPGAIVGAAAARLSRRPHVVHQHTYPYFSETQPARGVQRTLLARAGVRARFIAVADHVRDGLRDAGLRHDRIDVVPNGVPPMTRPPDREPSAVTVGMLARLDPGKNVEVFIAAASAVAAPSARFVVGGAASPFVEYERDVRARAAAAGVEVVNVGEGVAFLAKLDVVAIPSAYEGSPLVLLEAMALGRAVIASDIPGMREVLGDAGVLVPAGDATALAEAIAMLVASSDRRTALGARASEVACSLYCLETMIERTLGIIDDAVRGSERGG